MADRGHGTDAGAPRHRWEILASDAGSPRIRGCRRSVDATNFLDFRGGAALSRDQAMRIDHFEGAYGPTIWLDVDRSGDLSSLLDIFRKLARGDVREVELCSALGARTENLGGLQLRLEAGTVRARKRLVKTRGGGRTSPPGPHPPSFVWSNSGSGWKRCAKSWPLLRRDSPDRRDPPGASTTRSSISRSARRAAPQSERISDRMIVRTPTAPWRSCSRRTSHHLRIRASRAWFPGSCMSACRPQN